LRRRGGSTPFRADALRGSADTLDHMLSSFVAPNGRRYIVEPGVLDDRAALAFTNGHCHSLALALQREIGGQLLAFAKTETPFDHVLVRASDGQLIDIGGARSSAEVVANGGKLFPVSGGTLHRLPDEFGWTPPEPDAASPWVGPVLARVESGEAHHRIGCFTHDFELGSHFMIHIEWTEADGALRLVAFGRASVGSPSRWTRCLSCRVPTNADGEYLIDFSDHAFRELARQFEQTIRLQRARVVGNLNTPREGGTPMCPPAVAPTLRRGVA
jgi:hypothetical protein